MKSVGVLLALTGGSRECAQKKLIEREQSIHVCRLVVPHPAHTCYTRKSSNGAVKRPYIE